MKGVLVEEEYTVDLHPTVSSDEDHEKHSSIDGIVENKEEIYEFVSGAEVAVTSPEKAIPNPYHNIEMANDVEMRWVGKLPLCYNAIVKAGLIAKSWQVDNSNSQPEGIICWLKEDNDFERHCISFTLYIIY